MVERALAVETVSGLEEDPSRYDLHLDTDLFGDLSSLTSAVSAFCDRAEASGSQAPLLMRLGGAAVDWPGTADMQSVTRWEREIRRVERLPRLLVGIVAGVCAGPALDLLLISDVRIASPESSFRLAVNRDCAWPGMAVYRLALQIGVGHARPMALLGRHMTAPQAAASGLIDEIDQEPWRRVQALWPSLLDLTGKEVAVRRSLLREATASAFDDALGAHLAACARELGRLGAGRQP